MRRAANSPYRVIITSLTQSVNIVGPLRQPPDKQHILDSQAAIARGARRPPSRSEFVSLSGISEHQVSQFFPTWSAALRAAELRPYTLNLRLEDRELLEDWGHADRRNRKIPARRAYHHLGKFDHRTFERRFGPWSKLPEVFRNFTRGKPEWADVLALLPAPLSRPSPKRVPNPPPNSIPSRALNKDRAPNRQPPSSQSAQQTSLPAVGRPAKLWPAHGLPWPPPRACQRTRRRASLRHARQRTAR